MTPRRADPQATLAHRELWALLRLAREWELCFERLFRTGAVSKWYSAVGNEGVTVPAATALEPGDALITVHRDSGAILRHYLDIARLLPGPSARRAPSRDPVELLHTLAAQLLGKADGFTAGRERSYHYSLIDEPGGIVHVGMISHLGAMLPVAAGLAMGFRLRGSDRVALAFIGEGGTSTGDFHEALNLAAVWRAPMILVVENNGYAFSTPARQQFLCETLADRGRGYGIPGVRVDGTAPLDVLEVIETAVRRARAGEGPTLVEAVLGRMRGHSEGDDSLGFVPPEDRARYAARDPVEAFEAMLASSGAMAAGGIAALGARLRALVREAADGALAGPDPPATTGRGGTHGE